MLEYIKAIILGIVEGLTEWLPISSTGHLILLGRLLDLSFEGADAELSQLLRSSFDVVIQSGAILAVLVIYLKRLLHAHISLYLKLAIATLPAGVIGILADKICELNSVHKRIKANRRCLILVRCYQWSKFFCHE